MAKISCDPKKVHDFTKNTPFVQLPTELLYSYAWHSMGINERRLMEFLIIEHSNHAGVENGNLIATYDQLHEFGLNRAYVSQSTEEARRKGLIFVEKRGRESYNKSYCNRYTLTFFKAKYYDNKNKTFYYAEPTNNWKKYRNKKSSN